jgi:[ribosomal protein S18]-alanine N-acetyltransferase
MIKFIARLFARGEPVLSDATARDAAAIAALHAASFRRGWSEHEIEELLVDRHVIAHRATIGGKLIGFVISRLVEDEAEILTIAVAGSRQRRGLAGRLLNLHLRRLAAFGAKAIFLEVDEHNHPAMRLYTHAGFNEVGKRANYYPAPGAKPTAALVLRRDLV